MGAGSEEASLPWLTQRACGPCSAGALRSSSLPSVPLSAPPLCPWEPELKQRGPQMPCVGPFLFHPDTGAVASAPLCGASSVSYDKVTAFVFTAAPSEPTD